MTALVLHAARPESVPVIRCSPPSFAATIALVEEGVAHELRWLSFEAGEHKTPEMLRLNPAGTVPILVDGGEVVTDTVEILERIAGKAGHAPEPTAMDDARALKDAGMKALVALMKGAPEWAPLEPTLDAWEARLEREPARCDAERFDVASALALAYVATLGSLGFDLGRWPAITEFVMAACRRRSVKEAWPHTWPAI